MKHRPLQALPAFCSLILVMAFVPNNTSTTRQTKNPSGNVTKVIDRNPYYIIVDKSEYELKVYDDEGWYATYPIVFGSRDLGDKMREGDKRTPTGKFSISGPAMLRQLPCAVNQK